MINLSSLQSYNTLFNSLKQLPQLDTPGYSNIAGAYMAGKYGRAMNNALSSNLNTVIKSFRTDASDLNKQTKALTVQADRVGIKADGNAVTGISSQPLKKGAAIKIDQLATKQINQSTLQDAKQTTSLSAGNQSLTLSSGSKSYSVSINIQAGESNSSVLNKTAKSINDLGAGVKARVASDTLGNQQLIVESEKTGKSSAFSMGGDLGNALGLNQSAQEAVNAKFTYNDVGYETESNSVTLDAGKTKLELKDTTEETIALTETPDTTGLQDSVSALAKAYNAFQDTLKANPDNKALQAVSRQMDQMVARAGTSLEQFGITRTSQGKLEVDTDQLAQGIASNPDQARTLFIEKGSLSDKLQSRTDQLLKTPANALIDLQKSTASPSAYQLMNSGLMSQLSKSTQTTGNLFDMFL